MTCLLALCLGPACHLIFPFGVTGGPDGGQDAHRGEAAPFDARLPGEAGGDYCTPARAKNQPYAGGSGNTDAPYTICSAEQLRRVATGSDLDKAFRLMADVDLGAAVSPRPPIGRASLPFTGLFDGNGHTVSNVVIDGQGEDSVGFFGLIGGGTVKNLRLTGVAIKGRSYVGGLAGQLQGGQLERCRVTGQVTAAAAYVGGLVGASTGVIDRSSAKVTVTGTRVSDCTRAGGLVGLNTGVIQRSFAAGNVQIKGAVGGGLVGWHQCPGTISDTYATGDVRVEQVAITGTCSTVDHGAYGGGLVGAVVSTAGCSAVVKQSYATGAVTSPSGSMVGGLAGINIQVNSTIRDCFSTGPATGTKLVGGLIGRVDLAAEAGCYWDSYTSKLAQMCGNITPGSGCVDTRGIDTSKPQHKGYFFARGNPPLATWDFAKVWVERPGDYPALR